MTHRYWLLALILGGVALLAGCGGGGAPPVNGVAWTAYTPPDNVVAPTQRDEFVTTQAFGVLQTIVDAPKDEWIFPNGSIKALPNMASDALYPALQDILGGLSLGSAAAPPQSAKLAPLRILQLASRPRQLVQPAQAQAQTAIDWTDPEFGIHWTGNVTQNLTDITVALHGAGPNTDIDLNLTIKATLDGTTVVGATLDGTLKGQIAAKVNLINWTTGERTTVDGRATVDATLTGDASWTDITNGTFSADVYLLADFETLNGATWELQDRQELDGHATGSWDADKVTIDLSATTHDGTMAGAQLFWARHALTASGQIALADLSFSGTLHDDLTFSNGMTGTLDINAPSGLASATVTGQILAADGTTVVATISGSLDPNAADADKLSISWYGGPPQVQDWYYL